jgi:hypothetical protein
MANLFKSQKRKSQNLNLIGVKISEFFKIYQTFKPRPSLNSNTFFSQNH